MTGKPCFWCSVDPDKKMPNDISPYSTWCPHYRSPALPPLPVAADGSMFICCERLRTDDEAAP